MNAWSRLPSVSAKIAVLGAGANGASIGADLTRAGLDVTLIEQWPAHVEAMRATGIRVETGDEVQTTGVRVLNFCQVAEIRKPFDVVLLLVKAYDTPWAARLIEPVLARDGLLVGAQNGMTAGAIADAVGASRTIGCVIEVSSTMYDPGVVIRHTPRERSWFAVGSLDGSTAGRTDEVAAILGNSGRVDVVDDIQSAKWMKLVSNSSVLVPTAALGMPMADALAVPGMRRLMVAAGQEALDVGAALGHPILPIFGLTASDLADRGSVVETMLDFLYDGFVRPGATTTVLQDWRKGRRSEAGDINGHVAAEGARLGVPTPVNDAILEVARRIESGALEPRPDNLELLVG